MGRSCCVPGCYNTTRNHPPITFYPFPTDPDLCQIWVANMGRPKFKQFPLQKDSRVCSIHFEDSAFAGYAKRRLNFRLKPNAIPTLFPWTVQRQEPRLKLERVDPNQSEAGVASQQGQGRDEPGCCLPDDKSGILNKEIGQGQGSDDKSGILNQEICQGQGRDDKSGILNQEMCQGREVSNLPEGYECSRKFNVPETFACLRNVNQSISSDSLVKEASRVKLEANCSGDDDMIDINDYLQRAFRESQAELKTNTKHSDMGVINEYLQRVSRDNNNKNDAPETFSCFQTNFNQSQFTSEVNLDEFSLIQNSLWENSGKMDSRHDSKPPNAPSNPLRRINVKTAPPNPLLRMNVNNAPSILLRRINVKKRSKKRTYGKVNEKYHRALTTPSTSTAVQRHASSSDASNNPERYQCLQTKFKSLPSTSATGLQNFAIDGATRTRSFPVDGATVVTGMNSNPLNGAIYSDSSESNDHNRYVKPRRDSSSLEDGPSSLRFYKPKDINRYTGFASFLHLLEFHKFLMPEAGYLNANESRFNDDDNDETERSLSHIEELIIVLTRLRLNLDENVLSDMYDVSREYVLNVLLTWIPFLASKLEYLPIYPSRKEVDRATPPIIFKAFPHLRLLIDFLEFLVEVSDNSNRFPFKRKKMLKAIIGVSPIGRIVYFSKSIGGDVTRDTSLKRSGLLDTLDEGDLILSGIKLNLNEELRARNVTLNVPDFLSTPDYLSPRIDKLDANEIMKLHLNKSLKRIREFKIFSRETAIPRVLTPIIDDIFTICCHLANFTQS